MAELSVSRAQWQSQFLILPETPLASQNPNGLFLSSPSRFVFFHIVFFWDCIHHFYTQMKIPVHPEAMDIIDIPMTFDNDHLLVVSTYPSEKYKSSSVGIRKFPIYGNCIPSGTLVNGPKKAIGNIRKSPFCMDKSHRVLSIAMLNYQRVWFIFPLSLPILDTLQKMTNSLLVSRYSH